MTSGSTMNAACETVAERVALGESLDGLTEHVATCPRCKHTVVLPSRIATATVINRGSASPSDPGLGFSARMTIGAQHKLVVRRRRRIVTGTVSGVAAAAVAAFALTRTPSVEEAVSKQPAVEDPTRTPDKIVIEDPIAVEDSELAGLVRLADTKRAVKQSASWGRIRRPLAPYVQLVKGVAP